MRVGDLRVFADYLQKQYILQILMMYLRTKEIKLSCSPCSQGKIAVKMQNKIQNDVALPVYQKMCS